MYLSSSIALAVRWLRGARVSRGGSSRLPAQVLHLGVTSLVTDVSSEMVDTILPLYARYVLEFSPLGVGALDGGYHVVAALGRILVGAIADRTRRLKELALVGYALSLLGRVVLAFAGVAPVSRAVRGEEMLVGAVALDRMGKGLRAAPRDALIARAVPEEARATAFGVHRALDALGSVIGPLLGVVLLTLVPMGFDVVFVVSSAIALLGVVYFLLFVRASVESSAERSTPTAEPATEPKSLPTTFAVVVVLALLVSLSEISPGLLYVLVGARTSLAMANVGLLHVGAAIACAALALPAGWAADRIGARGVLLAGMVALVAAYVWILLPLPAVLTCVGSAALVGAHYAATEGVLVALASRALPPRRLAMGISSLSAVGVVGRLVSSLVFGWVWQRSGTAMAVVAAAAVAAVTLLAIGIALVSRRVGAAPSVSDLPPAAGPPDVSAP